MDNGEEIEVICLGKQFRRGVGFFLPKDVKLQPKILNILESEIRVQHYSYSAYLFLGGCLQLVCLSLSLTLYVMLSLSVLIVIIMMEHNSLS